MTLPLPNHAHRCAGRTGLVTGLACPLRPTCLRYTTLLDHHNTLPDHVRLHIPIASTTAATQNTKATSQRIRMRRQRNEKPTD